MKVVVTGGAGFIGSNLARALLARSEIGEVAVVDDLSTGSLDNLTGVGVTFHQGSFLDEELMDKA
ncbi:MAG TPA: NAD-dependent epimerase/dehydratase family protein, partial [Yinghuangia sp.]|nr:NAD-dependent epimerase/dehydratase family protein [Yinghuangia sp.]